MTQSVKRLLCGAMALALIVPAGAGAQSQARQRPGTTRPAPRPEQQRPNRPNRPHHPARPGPPQRPTPSRPRPPHNVRPPAHRPHPNRPIHQPHPNRPIHRPGYRPAHVRRIHVGVYHYPHGYHYRRWAIGRALPRIFLSHHYYYNNWYDLGFGPPPHGFAWIRYGPDLLLVNLRTGHIVDVAYGVFY